MRSRHFAFLFLSIGAFIALLPLRVLAESWGDIAAIDTTGATAGKLCTYSGTGTTIVCTTDGAAAAGSTGQIQYNNAGSFGGAAALTYATSGDILTVTALAATDKPLIVKGAASQSANLMELRNSSGTALTTFDASGNLSGVASTMSGASTALTFIPTGSSAPTNGMYLAAANKLGFSTNSTSRMVIDSSGNVGIGITSPGSILETDTTTSGSDLWTIVSKDTTFGRRVGFYWQNGGASGGIKSDANLSLWGGANVILTPASSSYSVQANGKLDVGANGSLGMPGGAMAVNGGVAIGNDTTYFQATPPSNGLIVKGNVGIGTTSPTNLLSLGGAAARTIWMERGTVANTAGFGLTLQSGGATSGATDKAGGDLVLSSGTSTGTGTSGITFKTFAAGSSGTTDNTATTAMTIDGAGNVGIGTTAPASSALLDLTSTAKGALLPRMTTTQRDAIGSPATGLTVYNTTTNALNVFNGTAWGAVGSGGGSVATLTDVTLTSAANNDILRYNGTAWVNVNQTTAMSTTTMLANWPDAIQCVNGTATVWLYHDSSTSDGTKQYYEMASGSGAYWTRYVTATGAYDTHAGLTGYDCVSSTWSVTNLYAQGKAFNFIGTGAVTTFNAGTASAPGLALTSDTNTGLWSSGADTLNISTGGSERMRVDSSGNVGMGTATPAAKLDVAGSIKVADGGETCDASHIGTIRYNSGTSKMQICK